MPAVKAVLDPPPHVLDPLHEAPLAGYRRAALMRPPSWSDPSVLPSVGAFCSCCSGRHWWSEATDPSGWRCRTCHPPPPGREIVERITRDGAA